MNTINNIGHCEFLIYKLFLFNHYCGFFSYFSDRTVHSSVDIIPVDRAGKWSRTGGPVVQQGPEEPHELFHHAPCTGRRVFFFSGQITIINHNIIITRNK